MRHSRLILAEDEFVIALDLEAILSELGYEVVGLATSAPALICLAETHAPDLALVDVRLAGGTSGLHAVRQLADRHRLPSIVISGHIEREAVERAGAVGLLSKPVQPALLDRLVAAACAVACGAAPAAFPAGYIHQPWLVGLPRTVDAGAEARAGT